MGTKLRNLKILPHNPGVRNFGGFRAFGGFLKSACTSIVKSFVGYLKHSFLVAPPNMGKGKGPKAPKDEACIEKCGQETCKDDPCHMCVTTNCANIRPGPRKGCMRRNCSEVCTEGKDGCMPTCVRECPNKE